MREEATEKLAKIKSQIRESRPITVKVQDQATKLREAELRWESAKAEAEQAEQSFLRSRKKEEEAARMYQSEAETLQVLEATKKKEEYERSGKQEETQAEAQSKVLQAMQQGLSPHVVRRIASILQAKEAEESGSGAEATTGNSSAPGEAPPK